MYCYFYKKYDADDDRGGDYDDDDDNNDDSDDGDDHCNCDDGDDNGILPMVSPRGTIIIVINITSILIAIFNILLQSR